MSKYSIKRLSSIKDNYLRLNGVSFYSAMKSSSAPEEQVHREIYSDNKRKLDLVKFKSVIQKTTISSPINQRIIDSESTIKFTKDEDDREINCFLSSNQSGFLFTESIDLINSIILAVLTKYKNQNKSSSWNYFSKKKDGILHIYVSLPTLTSEYEQIVQILTEISEATRVLAGYFCKINIVLPKMKTVFKQKEYSSLAILGGVIIGRHILGLISNQMIKSMTKKNTYSLDVENKLLGWANKQKDLMVINLGDNSFYVNQRVLSEDKGVCQEIMKNGNSDNPKTVDDFLKISIENNKDLVVYSDTNSTVVLAHELGHYLVSKKRFLKRLQNSTFFRVISKSDLFILFVAVILGITGHLAAGVISALLMKSPELISEFCASYYGLKLMKDLGCKEEDLNKAKSDFKKAYITYLNNAVGLSLYGVSSYNVSDGDIIVLPSLPDLF